MAASRVPQGHTDRSPTPHGLPRDRMSGRVTLLRGRRELPETSPPPKACFEKPRRAGHPRNRMIEASGVNRRYDHPVPPGGPFRNSL
jgi:hypothetical protein